MSRRTQIQYMHQGVRVKPLIVEPTNFNFRYLIESDLSLKVVWSIEKRRGGVQQHDAKRRTFLRRAASPRSNFVRRR